MTNEERYKKALIEIAEGYDEGWEEEIDPLSLPYDNADDMFQRGEEFGAHNAAKIARKALGEED